MQLTFVKDTHEYFVDGEKVPSVSDICRFVKNEVYSLAPEYLMKMAAERGTAVHEATELLDNTGKVDIETAYAPYLKAYATYRKEHKVRYELTEQMFADKDGKYAGTIDRYGEVDGKMALIDIKTSSALQKPLYETQLNLYRRMLEQQGYKVEKLYILHLKKDGKYRLVNMPIDDELANACLTLHEKTKKKRRAKR